MSQQEIEQNERLKKVFIEVLSDMFRNRDIEIRTSLVTKNDNEVRVVTEVILDDEEVYTYHSEFVSIYSPD